MCFAESEAVLSGNVTVVEATNFAVGVREREMS